MTNIIGVKSQLAKLMATENITVAHKVASTASFNLKDRTLTLPLWKDMSNDLYDTLVGHEVGHALDSPHGKEFVESLPRICDDTEIARSLVNVVEDARIERLIKRRYPGLRRSFVSGYRDMIFERNLLGIQSRNMNTFNFPDRINIFFKLGNVLAAQVRFTVEEQAFIDRIAVAETYEHVVQICQDLYKFIKDYTPPETDFGHEMDEQEQEEQEGDSGGESGDNSEAEDGDAEDGQDSTNGGNKPETIEKQSGDPDAGEPENNKAASNHSVPRSGAGANNEDFISQIDKEMEDVKKRLISQSSYNSNIDYVTIPVIDPEDTVIDYKTYHNALSLSIDRYISPGQAENVKRDIRQFQEKNNNIIGYLLRQFETKKAADEYVRTTTSRTGMLDMSKLHTYKYNDDLFKKASVRPGAKNHGLVMFIDLSGSMHGSMAGTIEQLITLVMFCRRASIAFEVFGISDNNVFPEETSKAFDRRFEKAKVGEIILSNFKLFELFNSRMTTKEYNRAMFNMFWTRRCYSGSNYGYNAPQIPSEMVLNGTPLQSAIIASRGIIKRFVYKNKVQIVNAVFLTDGDAGDDVSIKTPEGTYKDFWMHNCVMTDKMTGIQYRNEHGAGKKRDATNNLFRMLRHSMNINVIGFFLGVSRDLNSFFIDNEVALQKAKSSFKSEKYAIVTDTGYNELYVIPNKPRIETTDLTITGKKTNNSIAKEFSKFSNAKMVSRVVLSKFIDQIAY